MLRAPLFENEVIHSHKLRATGFGQLLTVLAVTVVVLLALLCDLLLKRLLLDEFLCLDSLHLQLAFDQLHQGLRLHLLARGLELNEVGFEFRLQLLQSPKANFICFLFLKILHGHIWFLFVLSQILERLIHLLLYDLGFRFLL